MSFTDLAPLDIATYYLGSVQRLREAQARREGPGSMQGSNPVGRVELANGFLRLTKEQLIQLAYDNPDKARAVRDFLNESTDPDAIAMAQNLERVSERQGAVRTSSEKPSSRHPE